MASLSDCNYVAYADKSYVVNIGSTLDEAKRLTNSTSFRRTENLRSIGMAVIQAKVFSRTKQCPEIKSTLPSERKI